MFFFCVVLEKFTVLAVQNEILVHILVGKTMDDAVDIIRNYDGK